MLKISTEKEPKFVSPLIDIAFKTCWLKADHDLAEYFHRLLEYSLKRKVKNYTLGPNETGVHNMENIANKVDILLVSDEGKIDIELNNVKDKSGYQAIRAAMNKSLVCLAYYASTYYDKDSKEDRYKRDMQVELINLNTFHSLENPKVVRADYKLYDPDNELSQEGIEYHNIYLPRMKELCYNSGEDILKDFAILMCDSYAEMEELSKGNKGREALVKMLKTLGRDSDFMSAIDREEYYDILKELTIEHYKSEAMKEGLEEGHKEGIKQGLEQGIEQGVKQGIEQGIEQGAKATREELIVAMYNNNISISNIANITNISEEEVKNIIKEKEN